MQTEECNVSKGILTGEKANARSFNQLFEEKSIQFETTPTNKKKQFPLSHKLEGFQLAI